ncbi:hypothetical protein AXA44_21840 [Rhodococcus sp. SC4]|nr:hypothetical protein AXA44_21840 [Rhodococcus sp. SC4]
MQALVDAAASLVGEHPAEAISGRAIAERAGVNYGLVHQYFGSKTELLRQGLNHLNRTFVGSVHAREVLEHFSHGEVDSFSDPADRHYFRALAYTALAGRLDELESSEGAVPRAVEQVLTRRGVGDSAEARTDVALGLSMLLGWALCEEDLSRRLDLKSEERADFDTVLSGLLTQILMDRPGDPPQMSRAAPVQNVTGTVRGPRT